MPNPFNVFVRLIIVGSIVLGLTYHYQRAIMQSLLPVMYAGIAAAQDDLRILSLDIAAEGPNDTLRLRANLAHPVYVGLRLVYPIGWNTGKVGGYQITMTLGGALMYSVTTLIVALSWPIAGWRVAVKRLLIALPFMMALLLINVITTFSAELWTPIHNDWVPGVTWPLLVWSKVLMGGGGLILGLLFGALTVLLSVPKRKARAMPDRLQLS